MPPKRKYPNLNSPECRKQVMERSQRLRNKLAAEEKRVAKLESQLEQALHRNKEEREKNNESIHALNRQLNELSSAHKALKGQCAARGREMRAEQELHLRNVHTSRGWT